MTKENRVPTTPPHRVNLLKKAQVAEKVGLHPETIARLAREGRFPRALRLGPSMRSGVRWVESEVDAWLVQKIAERDAPSPSENSNGGTH